MVAIDYSIREKIVLLESIKRESEVVFITSCVGLRYRLHSLFHRFLDMVGQQTCGFRISAVVVLPY